MIQILIIDGRKGASADCRKTKNFLKIKEIGEKLIFYNVFNFEEQN